MSNLFNVVKALWGELDSVIELFVYLGIAYGIQHIFGVTFMHGLGIVFAYFVLNLVRVVVETIRNKSR
jgi:predicted Kef-type K+ transport protein